MILGVDLTQQQKMDYLDVIINQKNQVHDGEQEFFDYLVTTQMRASDSQLLYKVCQVVRILTRSKLIIMQSQSVQPLIEHILELIDQCVNQSAQAETLDNHLILIECASILKRVIFQRQDVLPLVCKEQSLQRIIKLIVMPYNKLILGSLDLVDFLHDHLIQMPQYQSLLIKEINQLFYLGKIIFIVEKSDDTIKKVAVNLITKLLDNEKFQDNFRTIQGGSTIINELKKASRQQLDIRIPLLNCILKMVQKGENIFDLKVFGIVSTLQSQLEDKNFYMVIVTTINILCHLALDEDLSLKMMDKCLSLVVKLLFDSYPTNKQDNLKFKDVSLKDFDEAIQELQIYCFKLLRFLYSNQRNRGLVKTLFTPRLLQIFIDVGNYVRSLNSYKKIMVEFNRMNIDDLKVMEARFTQIFEQQDVDLLENLNIRIRQYTLIKVIGKGAFGEVYLCQQGDNKYALKKISLVEMQNSDHENKNKLMNKYMQEVNIHKTLNHPNITKFYECFEHEDSFCLIIEYVEGVNLSEFISTYQEKGQRIPEPTIWKILINLCTTLKYLHDDNRIVHRDLNPANIMITIGQDIKLCDFGLAKYITDECDNMLNSFVGTLVYACPEIIENQPYNEKADIWALGCIAYELVTLKSPFLSNNALQLAKKIVLVQYEELSYGSQQLIDLISRCLVKDQSQRPTIIEILHGVTSKLVECLTSSQVSEQMMSDEMITMKSQQQKINRDKRDLKKIKLSVTNLKEIDPVQSLLEMMQKILIICNSEVSVNHKRYVVDQFYNRVILNKDKDKSIKLQMKKLYSLAKEDIPGVWVQEAQTQRSITYEQLYFYIQELYDQQ